MRAEQKGPKGFEDRASFEVVNRDFEKPFSVTQMKRRDGSTTLQGPSFSLEVPSQPSTLEGIVCKDSSGKILYRFSAKPPKNGYLPAPGSAIPFWTLSDSPRLIPPAWGATPAPTTVAPELAETSGWDLGNDAPDVYLFVPKGGKYESLRRDFLGLTGPIPKPPLSILGFIDSRWYPYTEKSALDSIDTYRSKGIPMDTFVVDTDWRINGSAGYDVETKDFPDMARFIQEAHDRHAKLMFNDHPDPKSPVATNPKELAFRYAGLTKLLDWGMDYWWYDRNWVTSLAQPMPGIAKEVWGQRLYHDITQRDRPTRRPWIMSNAEGIDNGMVHYAPNPAGHRYPMMWTGDTGSRFEFLKRGVQNGVNRGVDSLQPYTHEDLGGHTGPTPSPELYIRYLEYGCLSPITRVHCTLGQDRHPWAFGTDAEEIVKSYIKLRYRLLPMIYSAAQRTTDDGTPILRRCDLNWPSYPEAASSDQYLLGDDLLVAPITQSIAGDVTPIPGKMLSSPEGSLGLKGEYFSNTELSGTPVLVRNDAQLNFDWNGSPGPGVGAQNFTARWNGTLGPVPATGTYSICTTNDDGVRVWIDGKLLIDDWKPEDSADNEAKVEFAAGTKHTVRIEFLQLGGGAVLKLGWKLPSQQGEPNLSKRSAWIPPGKWQDLWTGEVMEGPRTIQVTAGLETIPIWARVGGVILSGPDLQYTGEKPNDPIVANVFVGDKTTQVRELDEDDGISNDYLKGKVARTPFQFIDNGQKAVLEIGPTHGTFGQMPRSRRYRVAIHLPWGKMVRAVMVDRKEAEVSSVNLDGSLFPQNGGSAFVDVPVSGTDRAHRIEISYK